MRRCFPSLAACFLCASACFTACTTTAQREGEASRALDDWHQAASRADKQAYFGAIADDGVFLGTDDTERWTLPEFREDYEPYFDSGRGWTFVPRGRIINMESTHLAWFDELLDSEHLGVCRGSGVLRFEDGRWVVVQYNLSIPIPNDMVDTFVPMINEYRREKAQGGAQTPTSP